MDLLTEAFAISEKSLDLNISYEDLLKQLNIYLNDNVIDRKVDDARENGVFSLPTSKPNEFKSEGQLITKEKPYLEARFSFIQKISDNPIKRNNYKLLISSNKNKLIGTVTDANGKVLKFNKDGNEDDGGVNIIFSIDTISYNKRSITKPRAVAAGIKIDPYKLAKNNIHYIHLFKQKIM